MTRITRYVAWVFPTLLGIGAAITSTAQAAEPPNSETIGSLPQSANTLSQVEAYTLSDADADPVQSQVTSVSQLSDVKPTDWAFQALQSLVERYGCIVGYPDKTYRGNRALSRYEFAAGVNACLDRINELLAAATADLVRKEDLVALQKLQEEFAAELAALRGRVDALEARTATLEKQQFSTTTKLTGEVIFTLTDTFGDRATRNGNNGFLTGANARNEGSIRDDRTNAIFADRVRLALDTSFTGKDRLRTRLQARNITPFSGALTGTNQTRLGFDGNEGNSILIDKLFYRFPIGQNLQIQLDAANDEFYDSLISTLSPFDSSSLGAVSRFGRFNPILRINNPTVNGTLSGATGVTFAYKFNKLLRLEGGYSGDNSSNDPSVKNGLFNGSYTAIGQLVFTPGNFTLGVTYAHSYYPGNEVNLTGSTGSTFASNPFGAVATAADSVAGAVQYKFTPQLLVGGWATASFAHQRSNSNEATVLNWAAYLAFPDLLKKGSLGGILVGQPPRVIDNDIAAREDRKGGTLHLEAFYRYRLTDNIAITPGFFVILDPENNPRNDTQYVGVLRTTFSF
jgi:hypothetical protein